MQLFAMQAVLQCTGKDHAAIFPHPVPHIPDLLEHDGDDESGHLCCGQDIAIVTGAEFVAKDLGMKVETTGPESLGTARKVRERLSDQPRVLLHPSCPCPSH